MFLPLMDHVRVVRPDTGRPRTRPVAVPADRAYSSRAIRTDLRRRHIQAVIPEKRDQQANRRRRGTAGGCPVRYDRDLYKRRHTVECAFNLMKEWRGLATRYDRHAVIYRGAVVLAAILAWLR
ncbi:transposase [Mycobacterium frederiksbergense]|uniref:Transposase n=2 Tax=Mycolicibacterium frederiksbergense TaxID=117567 RepID=A0ABT6KVX5_9MYCO|nr:transposase [Mycolicibacterium frederiksbergense]